MFYMAFGIMAFELVGGRRFSGRESFKEGRDRLLSTFEVAVEGGKRKALHYRGDQDGRGRLIRRDSPYGCRTAFLTSGRTNRDFLSAGSGIGTVCPGTATISSFFRLLPPPFSVLPLFHSLVASYPKFPARSCPAVNVCLPFPLPNLPCRATGLNMSYGS